MTKYASSCLNDCDDMDSLHKDQLIEKDKEDTNGEKGDSWFLYICAFSGKLYILLTS